MGINPKHYLNTQGGDRIPVYAMEVDWSEVGLLVEAEHPGGRQMFAGDGIIWVDADGCCVAVAGEPDSGLMGQIRAGKRFKG